jgi:hypothetical protein
MFTLVYECVVVLVTTLYSLSLKVFCEGLSYRKGYDPLVLSHKG